jgi:apolipoprotein N-acyltransferase
MSLVKRIFLALAAALLLALGQPPRLLWIATFVGLVLFLQAVRDLKPRPAFWIAFPAGALFSALSVPWFFTIFPGVTPVALYVLFGLFFGLFAGVAAWIAPRFASPWLRAFWISAWWIAVEYYRCEWFVLRFPWITPGVAMGPTWLTPFVGVYGQSFLAVLASALIAETPAASDRIKFRIAANQSAGILLIWALAFSMIYRPSFIEPRDPVRVAAVQFEDGDFNEQFALTRAATNSPQLVAWCETALFDDLRKEHRKQFACLVEHAKNSNVVFVVGCHTDFGTGASDWFNTALTFDGSGVLGEHYKNRPVHLFNDGKPGTNAVVISTPLGKIGTPICFDCDYTEICRRMAKDGAEFFAVPARDAAQWGPLQRVQHALFFRLRAAECGRWFVVAMSSGITQIVDPHGNTRSSLPPFQPGVLCGTVGRDQSPTFYVRIGWLLPWALSLIVLATGIAVVFFPRIGNSRGSNFQ